MTREYLSTDYKTKPKRIQNNHLFPHTYNIEIFSGLCDIQGVVRIWCNLMGARAAKRENDTKSF